MTVQRPVLLLLLALNACTTVGPNYVPPETDLPGVWAERLEGGLTEAELDPHTLSHWWKTLGDSTLDSLIERAIAANLDLRTADAQLRQARAQRAITGGTRFPTIEAGASAVRAGSSDNAGVGGTSELYSSSFDAGWEIDIFGGRRRAIEAADADLEAAQEAQRDVLVSVLAEVALNYVELRTFQSQLSVAEENLKNQEETLEIVQAKHDAGAVTKLDLDRAVSNVENTRSEIPRLNQNISRAENRLAVLIGEVPGDVTIELESVQPLPTPPVRVAVGVPA